MADAKEREGERNDLSREGDDHLTLQAGELVLALVEQAEGSLALRLLNLDGEPVDDAGDEVGEEAVVVVGEEAAVPGDVVDVGGDDLCDRPDTFPKRGVGDLATNLCPHHRTKPCRGGHKVQVQEENVEMSLGRPLRLARIVQAREERLGVLPDAGDDRAREAGVIEHVGDGEAYPWQGARDGGHVEVEDVEDVAGAAEDVGLWHLVTPSPWTFVRLDAIVTKNAPSENQRL